MPKTSGIIRRKHAFFTPPLLHSFSSLTGVTWAGERLEAAVELFL
jgi:hypothetical protein